MRAIRDYGLIGDCHSAALVSSSGEIDWWCAPRFDSPPSLDALLGGERRVRTSDRGRSSSFTYDEDSNVLHAQWGSVEAWYFLPYPRREVSEIVCLSSSSKGLHAVRVDALGDVATMDAARAEEALGATRANWRAWVGSDAPPEARRSLLALKLLTYEPTGAIIAAPTTSLPEVPGGVRNWDYRYAWIRDTAFCAEAFAQWGKLREAERIAEWLLRSVLPRDDVRVLYRVDGEPAPDELEVDLPGYANSRPVRFGNGAIHQFQLDAYGHVIETIDACHALDRGRDAAWPRVRALVDEVIARWRGADNGIWEDPAGPLHHTYSKAMAWLALDRALALARTHGLPGPIDAWERERDEIRKDVLAHGVDPTTGAFTRSYDTSAPDAATLRLPLVGFVDAADKESRATLQRVRDELSEGSGLVRRYRTPDGLPGTEGAFLACSFWLAQLQHVLGEEATARETFDEAQRRASPLGLFAEEIDPATGALLGNYPQALSHAAHLSAAHVLRMDPRRRMAEA